MSIGRFGVLACTGLMILGSAGSAFGQITGSAHDFRYRTQISAVTGQGDQICKACHIPHNSVATVGTAPTYNVAGILWAKDYGTPGFSGQSLKVRNSVLCMGCHDGTISDSATNKSVTIGGSAALGTDLSNDHPVDLLYCWYDSQKPWAKGEFVDPAQITPLRLYGGLTGA